MARRHGCAHGSPRGAARHRRSGYLCDTWEGVVKTGAIDTYYRDGKHDDASMASVEELVDDWGCATSNCCRASSPTTRRAIADEEVRLCHIDVDVYRSAKDVLEWVWERLSTGGVVVFDDYGFPACPG